MLVVVDYVCIYHVFLCNFDHVPRLVDIFNSRIDSYRRFGARFRDVANLCSVLYYFIVCVHGCLSFLFCFHNISRFI